MLNKFKTSLVFLLPAIAMAATNTNKLSSESQIKTYIESKDYTKATDFGEKTYKKNPNSKIALYLGKSYFLLHDYPQAIKYFTKAANQGEVLAMLTLGNIYGSGTGVPQNIPQAIHWYQLAVARGNVDAMNYLGLIYRDGLNGQVDYFQAFNLFKNAALKSDARGKFNLAYMYQNGLSVSVDDNMALKYYLEAARQGDVYAMNNLGMMYKKGVNGNSPDYMQSLSWYTMAASAGDANAQCNVGIFYFNGDGTTKDLNRAKTWFILAKNNGCKIAESYLAQIQS